MPAKWIILLAALTVACSDATGPQPSEGRYVLTDSSSSDAGLTRWIPASGWTLNLRPDGVYILSDGVKADTGSWGDVGDGIRGDAAGDGDLAFPAFAFWTLRTAAAWNAAALAPAGARGFVLNGNQNMGGFPRAFRRE
jgi:hypothetical protein